jgi:hypothetical protein
MWFESRLLILAWLALPLLFACSGDPGSGPKAVKWDRDACERCRMVLSDRYSAAQVRYQPADKKRSRVVLFDDIGCAVLWLEDKPWRDDPQTEIWVADHRTGEWIDARQASYIPGKVTPMEYGLGAQPERRRNGLSFDQAKQHIFRVERRFNAHGVHLLEKLQRQTERRKGELDRQTRETALPDIIPATE